MSSAYQILGDARQRAEYDRNGLPGEGEKGPALDAEAFYALFFGCDRFEYLLGEMQLASMLSGRSPSESEMKPDAVSLKQWRRETQAAVNTAEMLDRLHFLAHGGRGDGSIVGDRKVDEIGAKQEFRRLMREEAKKLGESAFGGTLLGVLGVNCELLLRLCLCLSLCLYLSFPGLLCFVIVDPHCENWLRTLSLFDRCSRW